MTAETPIRWVLTLLTACGIGGILSLLLPPAALGTACVLLAFGGFVIVAASAVKAERLRDGDQS